ncbi:MAG: hypothetical protein GDA55_08705 [Cellvibrionales bacterium]|nr:hypothetical protein [Cellvibrionales bacterium]
MEATTATSDSATEVKRNFAAFQKLLPEAMKLHAGKFALMHDAELVEIYDSWQDAFRTGRKFYGENRFSVQQIETRPIDLGFHSHAII